MNENSCYFYRQPPTFNIQMRHYLFPNSQDLYLWFLSSSQLLLTLWVPFKPRFFQAFFRYCLSRVNDSCDELKAIKCFCPQFKYVSFTYYLWYTDYYFFIYFFFSQHEKHYLQNKTDTTHNMLLILLSIQCFLRLQFLHYFLHFFFALTNPVSLQITIQTGFSFSPYIYIQIFRPRCEASRANMLSMSLFVLM